MLIRALYRLSCTPNPRSQGLSLNLELTNAARLADQTSIRDPSNSLPHLQSYDYSSFCCEESQFHQEAASEKISKVELSLAPPRSADRDHVPQYAALWDHSSSHGTCHVSLRWWAVLHHSGLGTRYLGSCQRHRS
ncbi:hypothetical protein LEMLEM_LOCUS23585 [Lemmus lemmus]